MGRHLPTPIGIARIARNTYTTGWVNCTDWTNQTLGDTVGGNVVHNLGKNLRDLEVKVFISTDGTDNASFELVDIALGSAIGSDINTGITLHQIDSNTLQVQTGAQGIYYIGKASSGSRVLINTNNWYYRIEVTEKQPSQQIISINPSHFHNKFDTGWVANSDWSNQLLGNTPGNNLVHNLNATISDLHVQVLISPTESDIAAHDALSGHLNDNAGGDYKVRGLALSCIDADTLYIKTHSTGTPYYHETGSVSYLTNQSFYYRIIVRKWEI